MSNHPLHDVFILFDAGKLKDQSEEQLRCLYSICVNCQGNDLFSRTKADHIAKAILGEIVRLQNDRLVEQIGKLTQVANIQTQLAADAGKQAERLIRLTWALVIVSVALLIFALVQTAIMFKQDSGAHAQQIQASQH